jgi:hypothetical protein
MCIGQELMCPNQFQLNIQSVSHLLYSVGIYGVLTKVFV